MNKQEYIKYCDTHNVSIFMQPWWLDAVCCEGKEWRVLLSKKEGGIVGALPYLCRRKFGMNIGMAFQFTQLINADFAEDLPKLIDNERLTYFYQQVSYDEKTADFLRNAGFSVKNRVTYRIENLQSMDTDDIFSKCSQNKRRQIQKAEDLGVRLDTSLAATEMYQFHKKTLEGRGSKILYSEKLFCTICTEAIRHGQGKILAVRDKQNTLLAAVFLVWDEKFCYYLVPAYDKQYAKTGASAWLTFEAIKFAQQHSQIFDFEGSMIGRIAKNYRQYGSVQFNYYKIEKVYNPIFGFFWNLYKGYKRKQNR